MYIADSEHFYCPPFSDSVNYEEQNKTARVRIQSSISEPMESYFYFKNHTP